MELKEAIDKLFEMTDEQRERVFGVKETGAVLNDYYTNAIIKNMEDFYSKPKYGDVYLDRNGKRVVVLLGGGFTLCEDYECPQSMSSEYIDGFFTKTGKNVADELGRLFG